VHPLPLGGSASRTSPPTVWEAGAREFIAEFGLTFENLFDAPRAVPASLGGSGVPLTFFFEPGGELVHYQPGVIDERMLALQIDELLQRLDRG
jgi:hypothetical protein